MDESDEDEDKPLVHRVENMLKATFGSGNAWCNTRCRYLAIDIVMTVAHEYDVAIPMEFAKRTSDGTIKTERRASR